MEEDLSKLVQQLRMERITHAETRRQLQTSMLRCRALEAQCKALEREVGQLKEMKQQTFVEVFLAMREGVVAFLGASDRVRLAATARSWHGAVIGPRRRRITPDLVEESPKGLLTTASDVDRFGEWLALLPRRYRKKKNRLVPFISSQRRKLSQFMGQSGSFSDDDDDDDESDDESPPGAPLRRMASSPMINPRDGDAIELDLHRTDDARTDLAPLRRCLKLVCAKREDIGYCQGMNFVASFLLKRSAGDVPRAADVYSRLFEALDLGALYGEGMAGLKLLFFQLEALLFTHATDLAEHLYELNLDPSFYATSWFVTVLVNFLPDKDAIVAWDELVSAVSAADNLPLPPWCCDDDDDDDDDENNTGGGFLHVEPSLPREDESSVDDVIALKEEEGDDDDREETKEEAEDDDHGGDEEEEHREEDDGFAKSVAAQGWAVVFRIILICLRDAMPAILPLSFEKTLRYLQDFPIHFRRRRHSLAALLKDGHGAFLEREKPLAHQLNDLRTEYRDALEDGVLEADLFCRMADSARQQKLLHQQRHAGDDPTKAFFLSFNFWGTCRSVLPQIDGPYPSSASSSFRNSI